MLGFVFLRSLSLSLTFCFMHFNLHIEYGIFFLEDRERVYDCAYLFTQACIQAIQKPMRIYVLLNVGFSVLRTKFVNCLRNVLHAYFAKSNLFYSRTHFAKRRHFLTSNDFLLFVCLHTPTLIRTHSSKTFRALKV